MPHRILVVDDEKIALGAFERSLQLDGYTVSTAASGAAALKLCQENSFDLVILDFIMPKMDGIELLVRIRKLQPHIRAIVISGKLEVKVDERELGKQLGDWVEADLYLHKPISPAKLTEAVTSLLQPGDAEDWKSLAKRAVKGHDAKIAVAKKAARNLRTQHKRKK
jgi:two-component system response regulator VanR